MKKAPLAVVTMEKPKLLFLITINLFTAFIAQIFFSSLMWANMKQLERSIPLGLTAAGVDHLIISAVFLDAVITVLLLAIVTYSMERSLGMDTKNMKSREWLRAGYFSLAGVALVCAGKMANANQASQCAELVALAILLFFLGEYHLKFKEARQGIWFPHTTFQYLIQQLIFFPLGWWTVSRFIR